MADKYVIEGATYCGDGTQSNEAVGSTVTITIASPGVVTWAAHPWANNDVVYLTTTGALPTGLTAGTKYYVRNKATNSFELSATSGGASINTSGTQSGTHTARGVGAWNVFYGSTGIFENTAPQVGTLAAGDTVTVRSKTSAGGTLSRTLSASTSVGSSAATSGSPITWILDDGTVWGGINGTLTYTSSSSSWTLTQRNYNRFIARTRGNWVVENTSATPPAAAYAMGLTETRGLKYSVTSRSAGGGTSYGSISTDGGAHYDFKIAANALWTSAGAAQIIPISTQTSSARTVFDNPEVSIGAASYGSIFGGAGFVAKYDVRGGRLYGAGATTNIYLVRPESSAANAYHWDFVGFQVPKAVGVTVARHYSGATRVFGTDNGPGAEISAIWGNADCRNYTANYPFLNGTLGDSVSTPVTWRIVPQYASTLFPVELPISKLYTDTAAAKTVTMELLISDTWTAGVINKNSVWMTVSYIDDSSGAATTQTTRLDIPGTALDTSTVGWSATSWGVITYLKRKLSLTTATSIKTDTAITVTLYCTAACVSAVYDQLMMDPDVVLT